MKSKSRPKSSVVQPRKARNWQPWAWGAALIALAAIVYWPTLANGFIWDDEHYVEWNHTLRSLSGLREIWFKLGAVPQYYPLVHSTFWVEYHLWGLNPLGYHAVNLAIHAANAVLLWRLLVRLQVPGAWLAAAIFAVHPVHVESVAWVTERKNVLSLLLALAALYSYLRFSPAEANSQRGGWGWFALAMVFYIGALWSKTVTASVPAVLLVIYWWKRGELPWREALRLAPFFAIGLAMASVTAWMERDVVGAVGEEWNFSRIDRLLIAGRAAWFYAMKLVWPHPLIFFYPRWTIDSTAWWQYLFPLTAAIVLVALWLLRGRIGRGPLAAVLIFGGVLVPALGFFDVYPFRYSFVADHFQYHASIGLIALAAAGLAWLGQGYLSPKTGMIAAALLLVVLGALAHRQTYIYKNADTVYEDIIAKNPASWAAHLNLGNSLQTQGRHDEAIDHFRAALAIEPNPARANAHRAWGESLYRQKQYDAASKHFRAALEAPVDEVWRAHVGLANVLRSQQQFDSALAHLGEAIDLAPKHETWSARVSLGECLEEMGRNDQAAQAYREALTYIPERQEWLPRIRLADCLKQQKQFAEAIRQIELAMPGVPRDQRWIAQFNLGECYEGAGQLDRAIAAYEQALASSDDPDSVRLRLSQALSKAGRKDEAQRQLLAALEQLIQQATQQVRAGQLDEAEQSLRQAIAQGAKSPTIHDLMGVIYGQRGDLKAAIEQFELALAIDPGHPSSRANLQKARQALAVPSGT